MSKKVPQPKPTRPLNATSAARSARAQDTAARKKAMETGTPTLGLPTRDSFQSFAFKMGIGADSPLSKSTFGFNPITRDRTLLEWGYRGSWVCGAAIDVIAEDMTRKGVSQKGTIRPADISAIENANTEMNIWGCISDTTKWARLYGGAVGIMLVDGQDPKTALRIETVPKGAFKGLLALGRWEVEPSMGQLDPTPGPNMGMPLYYTVSAAAAGLPQMTVHHSRCLRLEGIRMPYQQRLSENMWGISVIERIYDRLLGFEWATTGASQLVSKAYLRTMKIENLREIIAQGGKLLDALVMQMSMRQRYQGIEGIDMIDSKDEFITSTYSFAGLSDVIMSLGQQLAGALQFPLVRLFGQEPGGFGSDGESSLNTYYDGCNQKQNREYKTGVTKIYRLQAVSLGIKLPEDYASEFRPLWQMKEEKKGEVAERTTQTVIAAHDAGLISPRTALKELKQSSDITGIWSNITDEEIAAASDTVQPPGGDELEDEPKLPGPTEELPGGKEPEGENRVTAIKPPESAPKTKDSIMSVSRMLQLHGLHVVIENPKDSLRHGKEAGDKAWTAKMPADYGYIRRTKGADEDEIDCFVGDEPGSDTVYVIDQRNLETGGFDEHKCMLGFPDRAAALQCYDAAYPDGGSKRIGSVMECNIPQFKSWLNNADLSRPASGHFKPGRLAA